MNIECPMSNIEGKYIVRFSLQHSKFLESQVKYCLPIGEMNGL